MNLWEGRYERHSFLDGFDWFENIELESEYMRDREMISSNY